MDPSDDGKVIDGKTVVWLHRKGEGPQASVGAGKKASTADFTTADLAARDREELAGLAAEGMRAAAENGVPFCEECEAARRKAAAQ